MRGQSPSLQASAISAYEPVRLYTRPEDVPKAKSIVNQTIIKYLGNTSNISIIPFPQIIFGYVIQALYMYVALTKACASAVLRSTFGSVNGEEKTAPVTTIALPMGLMAYYGA